MPRQSGPDAGSAEAPGAEPSPVAADLLVLGQIPLDDITVFDHPDSHLFAVIKDGWVQMSRWTEMAPELNGQLPDSREETNTSVDIPVYTEYICKSIQTPCNHDQRLQTISPSPRYEPYAFSIWCDSCFLRAYAWSSEGAHSCRGSTTPREGTESERGSPDRATGKNRPRECLTAKHHLKANDVIRRAE